MAEAAHGKMPGKGRCYLASLAPELFDNILFEIDSVRALSNLITTSRFICRRFEWRREHVIFRVLQNELGPVLTDARFLRVFPYADPGRDPEDRPDYWDGIHTMATVYMNMLAGRERAATALPNQQELTELCQTLYNVNFLAEAYISSRLRQFGSAGPATAPPSRTERLRILRAIYRRQIISNAWAPTRRRPAFTDEDVVAMSNTTEHEGRRLGLLAAFQPWEMDQVDQIDHFITQLCSGFLIEIEEGEYPTAQQISATQFGEIFTHLNCLVRYMKDYQSLLSRVIDVMPWERTTRPWRGDNIEDGPPELVFIYRYSMLCFRHAWQTYRYETFPDPVRDRRHLRSHSNTASMDSEPYIRFAGDAVDSVPFAWVDALRGRYVNLFGETLNPPFGTAVLGLYDDKGASYDPLDAWRRAGMPLWDRKRVEAIKALGPWKTLHTGWVMIIS